MLDLSQFDDIAVLNDICELHDQTEWMRANKPERVSAIERGERLVAQELYQLVK